MCNDDKVITLSDTRKSSIIWWYHHNHHHNDHHGQHHLSSSSYRHPSPLFNHHHLIIPSWFYYLPCHHHHYYTIGFESNMSAYGQLRQTIGEIELNSSLTKNEQLLQQAQMYASSPFIYGYQLRLIIGSLEEDLSKGRWWPTHASRP